MKLIIPKNTTSKIINVFILDASLQDGSGLVGLMPSDVTIYYYKEDEFDSVNITTTEMDVGVWTSGGFVDIPGMPGVYQIGLPNAMLSGDAADASSKSVILLIYDGGSATDTNIVPTPVEIQLGPVNSDLRYVNTNQEAVNDFEAAVATAERGEAVAGTLNGTDMTTDLTAATADYYKGRVVIWTSGNLENIARTITVYTVAGGKLTYAALPGALVPVIGDTFVIV